MNRKEFLKNISAIGAITLLPKINVANTSIQQTNFHFVGLGNGGTNALVEFSKKNIDGTFTAVNESFHTEILKNKNVDFFYFKNEDDNFLSLMKLRKKIFDRTPAIQNANEHFILLAGLGGLTGSRLSTALIDMLERESKGYTVIYSVPFPFEGNLKAAFADVYLKGTQSNKNMKYVYADNLRTKYPNLKMIDAMKTLDNEMYEAWTNEYNLNYSKN